VADTFTKAQRSRIMAAVRSTNTGPELVVRRIAHRLGYRYRLHVRGLPGTPDLVFPRLRKVIFVSGCFWHMHHCRRGRRMPRHNRAYWSAKLDRNRRRDIAARRALRRRGWDVLLIWECQTAASRIDRLQTCIAAFLG
jgi:DNA mismatch endonuclease (patch repair protein)